MTNDISPLNESRSRVERIRIAWRKDVSPTLTSAFGKFIVFKNVHIVATQPNRKETESDERHQQMLDPSSTDWTDGGNPNQFAQGRNVRIISKTEADGDILNKSTTHDTSENNVVPIDP